MKNVRNKCKGQKQMVKINFFPVKVAEKKNSLIHPHKTSCQKVQALLSFLNILIFFSKRWDLGFISSKCSWKKNGRTEICVMAGSKKKKNRLFSQLQCLPSQFNKGGGIINGQKAIGQNNKSEINYWNKNWDKNNCIIE